MMMLISSRSNSKAKGLKGRTCGPFHTKCNPNRWDDISSVWNIMPALPSASPCRLADGVAHGFPDFVQAETERTPRAFAAADPRKLGFACSEDASARPSRKAHQPASSDLLRSPALPPIPADSCRKPRYFSSFTSFHINHQKQWLRSHFPY